MSEMSKDQIVRNAILEGAKAVFQRWGLKKATMEDIAREAGKGKSTLYYHFESKEEIFDTVVTTEISGMLNRARESVNPLTSAKEKLKRYIITSLTVMKDSAALYATVLQDVRTSRRFTEMVRKQFERGELEFIKGIMTLGVQQKEYSFMDETELDTAAQVVMEILHSLEIHFFLEEFNSKHVDMAARLIAEGI
jgi:AcrR family transcriptional regulator